MKLLTKRQMQQKDRGLQGVFYIVDRSKSSGDSWWQLRLVESHYVVSAVNSKERVLECLETVCKRYKTYKRLMRALRDCEHHISVEDKKAMEKEYTSKGHVYSEEVAEVVSKATEVVKATSATRQALVSKGVTFSEPAVKVVEKEIETTMAVPKPLPKRKKQVRLLDI